MSVATELGRISLDQADPTPLFVQLDRAVRAAIATGALHGGDRMPTVRQLAGELGINPNTVARTYGELQRAGLLTARRGAGTFVSEALSLSASPPGQRRDRALRPIVDRLLADALSRGVPFDDILSYLHAIDARRSSHPSSAIES